MCGILRKVILCIMMPLLLGMVCHAQQIQRLNIRVFDCPLEEVINTISKHTNIGFVYAPEILKDAHRISIYAKDILIKDLLNIVLVKQGFQYKLTDRICIIYKVNIQVKGVVVNELGEPLAGATIKVNKGFFITTNSGGEFVINGLARGDTLSFYYVSHIPRHILYDGNPDMVVRLKLAIPVMEPVVHFAAYGYSSHSRPASSFMEVTNPNIIRRLDASPVVSIRSMLGFLGSYVGGITARNNLWQIRGQASIGLVPGSLPYNAPLIIIDGMPWAANYTSLQPAPQLNIMGAKGRDPFVNININDIESITVLRSGEGTAFYGSSGSNGVIVISTKQGKLYSPRSWKVNASMGMRLIKRAPKMMNTQQYVEMRKEAFTNDNSQPTDITAPDLVSWDSARYTDFRSKMFDALSREYDLQAALSGGSARTGYRLSIGYNKEATTLSRNIFFDRKSFAGNITQKLIKDKLQFNGFVQTALSESNAGIYDLAGYNFLPPNIPKTGNETYSISTFSINTGAKLQYRPLPSLDITLKSGLNAIKVHESVTLPVRWRSIFTTADSIKSVYQVNRTYNSRFVQPQLEYRINRNHARYNFLVGANIQDISTHVDDRRAPLSQSDLVPNTNYTSRTDDSKYNFISCFSHVDFRIKEKYLASFTYRNDRSSLLRTNGRVGHFGGIGAAWVFSEDSSINRMFPFINYGKIRAGYGITGNDQYVADNYNYTRVFPSIAFQGSAATVPVLITQRDYSWEVSRKIDLGMEIEFCNNRISLDVGVYRNRTGNQIIGYPDPTGGLHAVKVINTPAIVQNKGLEISLQLKDNFIGKVRWNSNFMFNLPNNKLLSFPGLATSPYSNRLVTGRSLNVQQGYQYTGVNPQTGLFEMADLNKDGRIDRNHDLKVLGDLDPKLYGTMSLYLNYKDWGLNLFLEGRVQKGFSMLSQVYANIVPGASMLNLPVEFLDRWRKPGDQATIQRLSAYNTGDTKTAINRYLESDAILVSVSYLRLRNVYLYYNINIKGKENGNLGKLQVYLNTENLFTLTKYKHADPQYQSIFTELPQTSITAGAKLSF